MTATIRRACTTSLLVLGMFPVLSGGTQAQSVLPAVQSDTAPSTTVKAKKSVFAEDGPVDTAWEAQVDSFKHALVRLPVAALLSAMLAFRPRRRGTPKRQAPVIQTQIILAVVGAMVMLVVGASLARAFGIVGAAGLIRYRAKVEDPKDAGVMLSTLAIGLASGVGLYVFAIFAAVFVLGVLLVIESIDPAPYSLFNLAITTKDSAGIKDSTEAVLGRRHIPFELRSTSAEEISYEVKLPMGIHTEQVSDELTSLNAAEPVSVKWETKKDTK
jgi:uncharacterized membrane protein YhiD involved in acid resistance